MHLKPLLATLAVATATLLGMSDAEAKRIGYTQNCWGGDPSLEITRAGHTPVALNVLYTGVTTAALVGLDGLFTSECPYGNFDNPDVNAALSNGLVVWFDAYYHGYFGGGLPGNRSLTSAQTGSFGVRLPASAAWAIGPGGTPSPAGLDAAPNFSTFPVSTLPADVLVMATDATGTQARLVSYAVGRGRVVVSTYASGCMLGSGACTRDGYWPQTGFIPAVSALTTNLFAWAQPAFTTCAAEGYTGSKLTLCRSVCETTQSSTTLTSKIKLYTAIYRETPPCAL